MQLDFVQKAMPKSVQTHQSRNQQISWNLPSITRQSIGWSFFGNTLWHQIRNGFDLSSRIETSNEFKKGQEAPSVSRQDRFWQESHVFGGTLKESCILSWFRMVVPSVPNFTVVNWSVSTKRWSKSTRLWSTKRCFDAEQCQATYYKKYQKQVWRAGRCWGSATSNLQSWLCSIKLRPFLLNATLSEELLIQLIW